MASTIVTKNSSTASAVPVTGDLTQGELAVNVTDKKLYTKDSGGTVVKIVGGLGNQEANAVAITGGSINGTTVGATTASTGAFTTLSASSTVSGTGFSTYLASPPAIGGTTAAAGSFTTLSASGNTTLSGGTANGVAYLNGSKVVTTGSALTFDGTNLGVLAGSVTSPAAKIHAVGSVRASTGAGTVYSQLASDGVYSTGTDLYLFAPTGYSNIFYANNSEGMRLTSTGLGIGATSPGVKLDVRGATGNGIRWLETSSGNTTRIQLGTAAGLGYIDADAGSGSIALGFRVGGANLMTLDSSGNLGLGVTPSAWGTAYKSAQVNTAGGFAAKNDGLVLAQNCYFDGTNWVNNRASTYTTRYDMNVAGNGVHAWYTYSGVFGTTGNTIPFTQAMTLDASGNLAVGLTSPSGKLHVNNTGIGQLVIAYNGTSVNYYDADTQIFRTGGATERARIDSSGNLLVGKTSTSQSTGGSILYGGGTNGAYFTGVGSQAVYVNRETSDGTVIDIRRAASTVGTISVTTTATAYNTSSDYRLKHDIAPMTGALAKVAALKPVTYKWNADNSDGEGFIAHELAEVVPHAVTGEKDAVDEEGNPVYQGIDTSFLVATLTAAIQELKAEFDAYKATHP